ncbi:MAG: hypothetical protein MZV70_41590 [Desulfobacterales bacterium]|nr:hypothetical protein [Desulfobacterales bacterium]
MEAVAERARPQGGAGRVRGPRLSCSPTTSSTPASSRPRRSRVEVEVVYDEPAVLDDYDGVEITPFTRGADAAADPLALNLMRITVDGKPIDDPGTQLADVQRCTDVALTRRRASSSSYDNLPTRSRASTSRPAPSAMPLPGPIAGRGRRRTPGALPHVQQLPQLHRAAPRCESSTRTQSTRATPSPSWRSTRRHARLARPSGDVPSPAPRSRSANSNTCCAPTTRTASSTRPRRSRCGWSTADRPPPIADADATDAELLVGLTARIGAGSTQHRASRRRHAACRASRHGGHARSRRSAAHGCWVAGHRGTGRLRAAASWPRRSCRPACTPSRSRCSTT